MQLYFVAFNNRLPITDFLFLITFIIWFLTLIFKKQKFRFSWFYVPLIIYFIALTLSTVFSQNPKNSLIKLLGEIYLLGLAVLTFNLVKDFEFAKKTILTWVFATSFVCVVSLITLTIFYIDRDNSLLNNTLSHYGTLPSGNYPRIQSTFLNPNMLCNYFNIGAMFAVLAYKFNWLNHKLFYIFALIFSISVFFTLSPGIGAILLCLGLWFWLEFNEKGKFVLSKISLVGGIISALFFFIISLVSPANLAEPSARILTWKSAWQTFLEYPIFGKGLGENVANVRFTDINGNQQFLTDAHNLWLNVGGESGIFGILAITFLSIYLVKKSIIFKFRKNSIQTACGLAFLGTFFYQGLVGSFEDARHLWVLIGLLASVCESDFSNQT
jgi:putative inorganic carbon (hco3(-)) transporter